MIQSRCLDFLLLSTSNLGYKFDTFIIRTNEKERKKMEASTRMHQSIDPKKWIATFDIGIKRAKNIT